MTLRRFSAIGVAALLLATVPACETLPPASGPALAQNVLAPRDRQIGAENHKEIVSQFGGTIGGPLATYVERIGRKVAVEAVADSRPADWTVTVLDSPVPNAMATPGGYLYITRGLLAMINSEAELASVLGHEAGHVAGQHSARRSNRATLAGIGTIAAAILGGGDVANIVNMGGQAWVSGYSRGQENDADSRGLRYSAAAGYDPRAAADMLRALERISAVEGKAETSGGGLKSIFATHPVTAERIQRVTREAQAMPAGGAINADTYLTAIDGITYGDAPDQGIIKGSSFRHGTLRLGFDAPRGFALQNSPTAVTGQAQNGANFVFAGGPKGGSLESVVNQTWNGITNGGAPAYRSETRRIHGNEALLTSAQLQTSGGTADVGVAAYRFPDGATYVFRTVAPRGAGDVFAPLHNSFRQLTAAEAREAARGFRIATVTVRAGETATTLAGRMAAPYNSTERFLALNGLDARSIRAGQRVKLIVD